MLDPSLAANRPLRNVRIDGTQHTVEAVYADDLLRAKYISHVLKIAKIPGYSSLGSGNNVMMADAVQMACMRLACVALPIDTEAVNFLNEHVKGKNKTYSREATAALQHIRGRRASTTPVQLQGTIPITGSTPLRALNK
ncbi:Uncharacterised protein [Candidatus Burarchaeum australiense]|nr:Uncharacterised protein [Candidatus Burarchaeum australiense]